MARDVAFEIQKRDHDYNHPFHKIKPYLEGYDIKIANLETSITESNKPKKKVRHCDEKYKCCFGLRCHFKSTPKILPAIVDYAGFNLLSIENNHMEDWKGGRKETREALNDFNVSWMDASQPVKLIGFKGCDILMLNYDISFSKKTYWEVKGAMLSNLRAAEPHFFKVLSVHGGKEYTGYPGKKQMIFAMQAIDNGADFVVFAHAHVPQTGALYKGKYIFYGLGNFVSDHKEFWGKNRQHVRDFFDGEF